MGTAEKQTLTKYTYMLCFDVIAPLSQLTNNLYFTLTA